MKAMAVVVSVVTKVMLWAASIIDLVLVIEVLVIEELAGVKFIEVGVIGFVFKFALSVSYSDVAADLTIDALAVVMIGSLAAIGSEGLAEADANANAFAVVMTALEFPVSTALEGFSR